MRQLRYFVRIVETGSMTKAAEHFRIAQTALGLQVRQLEMFLGGKLLERHSRGVVPTASGQLLFERSREILTLVDRTVSDVTQLQGKSAEIITFGLLPSQMQLLASELLLWSRQDMPSVRLRLIEEFRPAEAITRGESDLGIGCEVADHPGIVRIPLLVEELIFVAAPSKAGARAVDAQGLQRARISLADVLKHEFALTPGRAEILHLVQAATKDLSTNVRVAFEVQSIQAMKTLVAGGLAATLLPYGSVRAELLDGRLVGRRVASPGIAWTLYLVLPARRIPLLSEAALSRLVQHTVERLMEKLGPLARRVWHPDKQLPG
jgi:LysR family nitrogen assimilation transcriptional regulator